MEFKDLGMNASLLDAISSLGFIKPTEIQEKAIPVLIEKKTDFIGLAQTGTGKTAAFGLPLLERIDIANIKPQGLIICPTRELCLQITTELEKYAKNMRGLRVVAVYGGADIQRQMRSLQKGAHIVVATPGRIIDHLQRKTVNLSNVSVVVLDEADEMLKMGFQEDIDKILNHVPAERNTWLFSATMLPEVANIAKNYMKDPLRVTVGTKNSGASNIEHQYCLLKERDKYMALRTLIDAFPDMFGIVFCRTRRDAKEVASDLLRDGYDADALHGDLSQGQRDVVMNKFRDKHLQVLVATDVAARGIDVSDVTHVFHYHLPDDIEMYTHRSGRTARAGKSGMSIILANMKEARRIRYMETSLGAKIELIKVPSSKEVRRRKLAHFVEQIKETPQDSEFVQLVLPEVMESLADVSKEIIVKRLLALECEQLLGRYKKDVDFNIDPSESRGSFSNRNEARIFINLGTMDGLDSELLTTLVVNETGLARSAVFDLNVKDKFSFFNATDVPVAQQIVKALLDTQFNGRRVRIELAGSSPEKRNSGYGDRRGGGNFGGGREYRGGNGGGRGGYNGGGRDFRRQR